MCRHRMKRKAKTGAYMEDEGRNREMREVKEEEEKEEGTR